MELVKHKNQSTVAILIAFLFSSILATFLLTPKAQATISSYESIPEQTKEKVVLPLWKELRGAGFSAEATAGIMGNIAQESSFNPLLYGGVGCYGIFQWCPGHYGGNIQDIVAAHEANDFDKSAEVQVRHLVDELKAGAWIDTYYNKGGGGFKFRQLSDNKETTLEEWKKSSDIKQSVAVMLSLERPCPRTVRDAFYDPDCSVEMGRRLPQAEMIYEALKNVDGSPSSGSSEEGISLSGGGIIEEDELTGLPEKRKFYEDPETGEMIEVPPQMKLDPDDGDFSASDVKSLNTIETASELERSERLPNAIRTGISFFGLAIIFWSVLLPVAYSFDKVNSFAQVGAVKAVTLGRRHTAESPQDTTKGALQTRDMFVLALIAFVLGILLATGWFYQLILTIIFKFQAWRAG